MEFVTSLERHAAIRLAPAYWICAFAHRQHEAKEAKAIETGPEADTHTHKACYKSLDIDNFSKKSEETYSVLTECQ